jgi:GAF domain-containing protein
LVQPAQPAAVQAAASPSLSSTSQVQPKVGTPRPTPSNLGDDRLADAFEGLQDLAFLHTPLEAAEFVVRILGELIPCEAVSVALYDINAHELRFVASSGVGAAERKGDAVPTNVGILGRALLSYVRPTRVNDVPGDKAFDPGVDGRVGLEVQTLIAKPLAVGDRLLGAVQLLNRRNDFEFSLADENLLVYVADRLSDFLEKAKARGNPKRSVAR